MGTVSYALIPVPGKWRQEGQKCKAISITQIQG